MLNFRPIRDRLVWVSILVRKRLDLRHVLEVHFGRQWFGYLEIREQPINLYLVLSSYWNTNCERLDLRMFWRFISVAMGLGT